MIKVVRQAEDIFAAERAGVTTEQLADDGVDRRGQPITKPWGQEVEIYRAGAIGITRLEINAGSQTSMHCHPGKDVVLMVESGHGVLETLDGAYEIGPTDFAVIQRGAMHRTRTAGGMVLIESETPPNKCDLIRMSDAYGRGQGYEPPAGVSQFEEDFRAT